MAYFSIPVRLEESLFADVTQLTIFLEELYLKGGQFDLHVQSQYIPVLERSFDQIIHKHGIRKANFTYILQAPETV